MPYILRTFWELHLENLNHLRKNKIQIFGKTTHDREKASPFLAVWEASFSVLVQRRVPTFLVIYLFIGMTCSLSTLTFRMDLALTSFTVRCYLMILSFRAEKRVGSSVWWYWKKITRLRHTSLRHTWSQLELSGTLAKIGHAAACVFGCGCWFLFVTDFGVLHIITFLFHIVKKAKVFSASKQKLVFWGDDSSWHTSFNHKFLHRKKNQQN